ncbi:hypothetical protein CAP36_08545 [Chitinophagaceae bacterium IBVUCB2]|nr:hypothetical protein CAP36_08545 [Chitinophagaceae bacterium IBVUCB2]
MPVKYTIQHFGPGGMHFISLDAATAKKLSAKGNKRVLCRINDTIEIHAALMKTKEGMPYVMIGSKYLKKLKLKKGNVVKAEIKIDTSELQFNIPEEFAAVMDTDPKAKEIFNGLTDGNKRGLIALVNMVKSTDKKIERALKIAERIKYGITSPQKILKKEQL